uniref:Uncharacterized protein n=1 Tax=Tetranychus urticae TaxID=32264 RepID=T1JQQ3_TETUR
MKFTFNFYLHLLYNRKMLELVGFLSLLRFSIFTQPNNAQELPRADNDIGIALD